ncbi:MAG TPA: hypothetical protein VKX16_19045 [Chloroflexota bacterium]|nr:hypothetical protein [Chloroflexota bacterium]
MTPSFMNAPAHYLHIGFVLISTANLLVIILMIVVFVAALLAPLPSRREQS